MPSVANKTKKNSDKIVTIYTSPHHHELGGGGIKHLSIKNLKTPHK